MFDQLSLRVLAISEIAMLGLDSHSQFQSEVTEDLVVAEVRERFPVVQHETMGEVLIIVGLWCRPIVPSRMRHTCKMKNG